MSAFAVVVLVGLALVVAFVIALGMQHERDPTAQLGLRSSREIAEAREAMDAEDLEQLLAAHNERRRRRGQPEMTVEDVEREVMNDRDQLRRST